MRLTVLGNPGRYLAPYAGGSGYLVEAEGKRVLLDCGAGVHASLQRLQVPAPLDAVVLSHFHHDHASDLVAVRAALGKGTKLFVPPGERARLEALAQAFVFKNEGFTTDATVVEANRDEPFQVGALRLRFAPTQHSAPSMATRMEGDGKVLVYASDSAPCDPLRRAAEGADLLLMHALLPTVDPTSDHARIHATAATAAALGVAAGARRLLLSHRYHESRDADMLYEARMHPGLALARELASYDA
ncbi:MAG TPA: MBL fold metallo-hydrolase [Candidatus Thermoplasmatota archaeon]|nr:MBL fold metallo-hydrolase [Candidatus Thermoplasmatota archaeon]